MTGDMQKESGKNQISHSIVRLQTAVVGILATI
jgi:hypothetical protein